MKFLKQFESFEVRRGVLRYIGPNPTADTILLRNVNGERQVLLIQRSVNASTEPGKWGIPGGFVDTEARPGNEWKPGFETIRHAAKREVKEETGLDLMNLPDEEFKLVGIFDDMNRDPRNTETSWVEGHCFMVEVEGHDDVKGMDDAQDAKWFTKEELEQIPREEFAFDHIDRLIELDFLDE